MSRLVRRLFAVLVCLLFALPVSASAARVLAPTIAGPAAAGSGANASFVAIDGNWQGSTVLWDEANQRYGQGSAIGAYAWGTGVWGRADWDAIFTPGSTVPRLDAWSGVVTEINHGDTCYNQEYSGTWGSARLVPLSLPGGTPESPCAPATGDRSAQPAPANLDNWVSRFTGYIRITDPGQYNFSVLYDDGFFFNLFGEAGQKVQLGLDFLNPRDRLGFTDNLELSVGLYQFELGAWDRLQAGIIDLRWWRPGQTTWDLVPVGNLVADVGMPGTFLLGSVGVLFAWFFGRRRVAVAPGAFGPPAGPTASAGSA